MQSLQEVASGSPAGCFTYLKWGAMETGVYLTALYLSPRLRELLHDIGSKVMNALNHTVFNGLVGSGGLGSEF